MTSTIRTTFGRIDVLMVASAGGHWQQLMLLREAFDGRDVHYATTLRGLAPQSGATPAPYCGRYRTRPGRSARCYQEMR